MKKLYLSLLLALLLAGCQSKDMTGDTITVSGASYTNISPGELKTMLAGKDFVFVNVHIPFEGDIAANDLSIPYDQITKPENLALLPVEKDAMIVLYCRSGRMSAIAAEALTQQGYTNLWNLEGGMLAWEQAGYPIEGK